MSDTAMPGTKPASASVETVTAKSTETTKVEPPFWQGVLADVHVNASGLTLFVCLGIGVVWPEYKPKCTEIAALAGTYLFASSKAK